jgi:hypothetical protein
MRRRSCHFVCAAISETILLLRHHWQAEYNPYIWRDGTMKAVLVWSIRSDVERNHAGAIVFRKEKSIGGISVQKETAFECEDSNSRPWFKQFNKRTENWHHVASPDSSRRPSTVTILRHCAKPCSWTEVNVPLIDALDMVVTFYRKDRRSHLKNEFSRTIVLDPVGVELLSSSKISCADFICRGPWILSPYMKRNISAYGSALMVADSHIGMQLLLRVLWWCIAEEMI